MHDVLIELSIFGRSLNMVAFSKILKKFDKVYIYMVIISSPQFTKWKYLTWSYIYIYMLHTWHDTHRSIELIEEGQETKGIAEIFKHALANWFRRQWCLKEPHMKIVRLLLTISSYTPWFNKPNLPNHPWLIPRLPFSFSFSCYNYKPNYI